MGTIGGRGKFGVGRRVLSGIITNGLKLYLDAGKTTSYSGAGTTWYDISGNGNNGTLTNGGAGLSFNSANGGSLQFDGSNDYVGFNNLTSYGSTNPHTYSAWIYPTAIAGATYRAIITNSTANSGTSLLIQNSGRILFFYTGDFYKSSINSLQLNIWKHITTTYNENGTLKIYFNGVLDSTHTLSAFPAGNNNSARLGLYNTQYPYQGNISNVQIYNRDLSATEVLQNYNTLKGRYI